MKAAIIERFGSITVREMPEPVLGDYDARCELLYGATCTGTDSHIIDGSFPWISPLPTVLGHESVGRVVELGRKVRHFRVGDLVTRVGTPPSPDGKISVTWGGFAEFGLAKDHWAMAADGLPAEQWQGSRVNQVLPAGIDPRVAPMFTTWRETLSWMLRCGVRAGASVLVVGSGGNGLSYAAHAVNLGCPVVAVAGAARLEKATRALAHVTHYLDYKQADLTAALKQACPGGFDFIIDAVGQQGVAERVLPALKPQGVYSIYGLDGFGKLQLNPLAAPGPFTFHGPGDYDEAETHQRISEWVVQGKLDARLWYDPDHAYPLAAINDAFAAVRARQSVKALVRLRG
jgi:L-iditol 2-dehydrogenase